MTEPRPPLRVLAVRTRTPDLWQMRLGTLGITAALTPGPDAAILWHSTVPGSDGRQVLLGHARDANDRVLRELPESGDSSAVRGAFGVVRHTDGALHASLSVTAALWLCYVQSGPDTLLSTDLPLLCALLARAAPLSPDPDAHLHHLLFRRQLAGRTYVNGVRRLLPGQSLTADARGLRVGQTARIADLRPAAPLRQPTAQAIDAFEAVAARVTAAYTDDSTALLLSGGVDSTLIGSLMGNALHGRPLISHSYALAIPEFAREIDYARMAAARLRAQHHFHPIDLADYPVWLERAIAASAGPISEEQLPCFFDLATTLSHSGSARFLSGEGSDDLLGIDSCKRWLQLGALRPLASFAPALGMAGRALAGVLPNKAHGLRELAAALPHLRDPLDPRHPANDYGFAPYDVLVRAFGGNAIRDAIAARRAVFANQLPADELPLIEYIHLLDFVVEMLPAESLAATYFARHGVTMASPYMDDELVAATLAFDASVRFYHRGRAKWLPKLLIERREQSEAARLPKQHGGFPDHIRAEMRAGTLRDWVRALPRPGWLAPTQFESQLADPDWMTWTMLNWNLFEKWLWELNSGKKF